MLDVYIPEAKFSWLNEFRIVKHIWHGWDLEEHKSKCPGSKRSHWRVVPCHWRSSFKHPAALIVSLFVIMSIRRSSQLNQDYRYDIKLAVASAGSKILYTSRTSGHCAPLFHAFLNWSATEIRDSSEHEILHRQVVQTIVKSSMATRSLKKATS